MSFENSFRKDQQHKPMAHASVSNKQREEILSALKARFEKNMNRHKGMEWTKVQAKLQANASSMTARSKALKAAEVFATTAKRWIRGKNTSQKTARSRRRRLWALSF